ncbi:molybdopterin converting factor subunit 1 [soil metagenome]
MQIRALYFAVFRERLGRDEEVLELPVDATVAMAVAALAEKHPVIAQLRDTFRIAVNQDFIASDAQALADRDELVLIPPVAGGNDRHVLLSSEALSLDRCVAAVRTPEMGGIVTFTGSVRIENHGATIDHLNYEAYAPMAIREMTRICTEVEAEIAGVRVAVEHRVGSLAIGDLAVVIAAAAPHRAEAFAACRAVIDRLKESVPIWKKEFGTAGEEWIGLGP